MKNEKNLLLELDCMFIRGRNKPKILRAILAPGIIKLPALFIFQGQILFF